MTDSNRLAMAVSSPVKVSCSLTNWTRTPLAVSSRTSRRRSSRLRARRSMECTITGVALAHEADQRRQLRALRVLARSAVGEGAIDDDAIQLTAGMLVEGAHSGIGDQLARDRGPPGSKCQVEP